MSYNNLQKKINDKKQQALNLLNTQKAKLEIDLNRNSKNLSQALNEKNSLKKSHDSLAFDLKDYKTSNPFPAQSMYFIVFVGALFDLLLWQEMFSGLESVPPMISRLLALVVAIAGSYATAELGKALSVRSLIKNRDFSIETNKSEFNIFNQATQKDSYTYWLSTVFVLFALIASVRYYTSFNEADDFVFGKFFSTVGSSLVVSLFVTFASFQLHCIYDSYYKNSLLELNKAIRRYNILDKKNDSIQKSILDIDSKIQSQQSIVTVYTLPLPTSQNERTFKNEYE